MTIVVKKRGAILLTTAGMLGECSDLMVPSERPKRTCLTYDPRLGSVGLNLRRYLNHTQLDLSSTQSTVSSLENIKASTAAAPNPFKHHVRRSSSKR